MDTTQTESTTQVVYAEPEFAIKPEPEVEEVDEEEMGMDIENPIFAKITTLLQTLQVDPYQIPINEHIKIHDLYYFHFEEETVANNDLFIEIINEASTILNYNISLDDTILEVAKNMTL